MGINPLLVSQRNVCHVEEVCQHLLASEKKNRHAHNNLCKITIDRKTNQLGDNNWLIVTLYSCSAAISKSSMLQHREKEQILNWAHKK